MVVDLFEDLRDGTVLITLLGVLTSEKLKLQRGNLVFHRRNNINTALQVLSDHGVKLVNISSDDIESGNPKLTLALIWLIALSFNGQQLVNNLGATSLEKNLLHWATEYTEKYGLKVQNFQSAWSDGRAFLYILNETLPKGSVDLNKLIALPAIPRLRQAFIIAREHLAIDQLLDPEDVHTTKPDKKSILMYVMSIYHALQSKDIPQIASVQEMEENVAVVQDIVSSPLDAANTEVFESIDVLSNDVAANFIPISHSRPISTATNGSMEISAYQVAIEEVLTMLLESEEILSRPIPPFYDLDDAKVKFRDHEEFMLKLSDHQRYVGSALEEGARLISESQFIGALGGLSVDEQNEIKQQMILLNERWETLRVQAMDVQSKIHSQLAEVEARNIETLRKFLTETEDRISRYGAVDLDNTDLEEYLKELQELQVDLEEQQKLVDRLGNLIVIVDDETHNFHDLEDKLAALGERWSHVVQWTQMRLSAVHDLRENMAQVTSDYERLRKWINTRSTDLKLMESRDVSEMGEVIKRIRELEYCAGDIDCCVTQIGLLEDKIRSTSSTGECNEKWASIIEDLIDQSDALKQIIDVQKVRLGDMGFDFSGVAEKPSNWVDFQGTVADHDGEQEHSDSKKAKLEVRRTDQVLDLELKIIEMLNFIDHFATSLKRIQEQHSGADLSAESMRTQLQARIDEYAEVKDLLDQCKAEGNVDLSMEENQVHAIGSKYDEFVFRMEDIDKILSAEQAHRKFQTSLTGLKLVLAELRDWYRQNGNMASIDELEEKIENMDSLSADIKETRQMCENNADPKFWKDEFDQFLQSWKDMKLAIMRNISEQQFNDNFSGHEDEDEELNQLLQECETSGVVYGELDRMNSNIVVLNDLSERLHDFESDDFNEESVAKAAKELKSKIMSQTIILENVHHFQKEHENIISEMDKLERAIDANAFDVSEAAEVDQLNEKFQVFGIEIKKLEIDIISLKNFCEIITTNNYSKYTEQVKEIVTRHGRLMDQYKENKAKIKPSGPSKSQGVVMQINEIEKWLETIRQDVQPLFIEQIVNSNELFNAKLKYQAVKEECDAKTVQFKAVNELASEILIEVDERSNLQKKSGSITQMVKALTKLNSSWNEITIDLYDRAATLERIWSQFGEFRTLIIQENGYFDKLEQQLNRSLESDYADAEEICEELDDLENIIRNHSGDRLQKIEEIGQELIDVKFMQDSVHDDVKAVQNRWMALQERAQDRAQFLDTAAKEAQNSESKISYLLDWIAKVDVILTEHFENDVGIEDLPHDFQRLMEEFEVNHQSLEEMVELVESYKECNRIEAAKRLEQQMELLRSRFDTCKVKLRKFTSPQSGFESRLNRAMGELRNIERSCIVLDTSSGESVKREMITLGIN